MHVAVKNRNLSHQFQHFNTYLVHDKFVLNN